MYVLRVGVDIIATIFYFRQKYGVNPIMINNATNPGSLSDDALLSSFQNESGDMATTSTSTISVSTTGAPTTITPSTDSSTKISTAAKKESPISTAIDCDDCHARIKRVSNWSSVFKKDRF